LVPELELLEPPELLLGAVPELEPDTGVPPDELELLELLELLEPLELLELPVGVAPELELELAEGAAGAVTWMEKLGSAAVFVPSVAVITMF
jgi:hypothetical protein